jgi:hypothetical protein
MAVVAIAGVAIHKGHELAENGLNMLRGMRRQLPNTFATLPSIFKEWEAGYSARIDARIQGTYVPRQPTADEVHDLNAWIVDIMNNRQGGQSDK